MPSGYLKHQRGISRKVARGSGGHFSYKQDPESWYTGIPKKATKRAFLRAQCKLDCMEALEERYHESLSSRHPEFPGYSWECSACSYINFVSENEIDDEDESAFRALFLRCKICETPTIEDTTYTACDQTTQESSEIHVGMEIKVTNPICPICCEDDVQLIHLMKRCKNRHEPACFDCLRRLYVLDAQESVSNYPLHCYHPSCRLIVRETQLTNHGLVKNTEELNRYFRLMELSKGYRRGPSTKIAHCPRCDHPRSFHNGTGRDGRYRSFACRHCHFEYLVVSDDPSLIEVLESLPPDQKGNNEGWAQCPRCKILISKGDGCDHMICGGCSLDFSWKEAQARQGKRHHHGRESEDPL